MNAAIRYWVSLMGSWWNYLITNPILSVSIVSVILIFVIKYLNSIKKVFK